MSKVWFINFDNFLVYNPYISCTIEDYMFPFFQEETLIHWILFHNSFLIYVGVLKYIQYFYVDCFILHVLRGTKGKPVGWWFGMLLLRSRVQFFLVNKSKRFFGFFWYLALKDPIILCLWTQVLVSLRIS